MQNIFYILVIKLKALKIDVVTSSAFLCECYLSPQILKDNLCLNYSFRAHKNSVRKVMN